ncbi:NAD(P)H-dependent oxidoreductase [Rhizobiaceae bacterium BDR2-2]|uniref:NAD(P)H-dependent oxidoreductase n=1 Tax=Ectorhizobium quercum TaxID=2965071 RepID=A0AAE3N495_9HYPH|nr:NAD(P)H-dependent oxidoreductase [Ectorhizobium quercum]MCX8999404.1 NAD(P)H-dependent oxidoreductase [Ectorhizobium quercum]
MTAKVALLIGSLRNGSFSRAVGRAIGELGAPGLELQESAIGDLPLYNPDLDGEAPPASWLRLRGEISKADAVLFVTPEYNRSVPAALKNALDVGSRPYGRSVWDGKPAAVVSISQGLLGGFGANHHLRQSFVFLNMPVLQQPEVYLSNVGTLFDESDKLANDNTRTFLGTFAGAFADWIARTKTVPAKTD